MTPTKPVHGHDDHLYADEDLHNEDVAHEHSDVNVRALLLFAAGLIVVAAVIHVAIWGLFRVFEGQAAASDPVLSPLAAPAGRLPPEPRLLTDEPQNLQRFRDLQSEALKGIDAAKKRLLEQGLPTRADAPTDAWLGTRSQARGESSSGSAIPLAPGVPGSVQPAQPAAAPPAGAAPGQPHPPKSGGH
jgi:hypothetical protein